MPNQEIKNNAPDIIIAVDPGREKCGIAVVQKPNAVIHKAIILTKDIAAAILKLTVKHNIYTVVVGNGTSSGELNKNLEELKIAGKIEEVISINEYRTTDMARIRYWQENPPQGWRRLLPVTMQVIPVPVDDYVAVILAEKYFMEKPNN